MEAMLGMISILPFQWAPYGYSFCQGQSVSVNQYQALYTLIGTLYGGTGISEFNLPDLRYRVPVGAGSAPFFGNMPLASTAGTPQQTLTQSQLPIHTHQATFSATHSEVDVYIPPVASTLNVAVDVDVYGAAGEGNIPTSTTNVLSGVSSTNTKMYSSAKTTNLVKLGNVNTTVTGNAGSPAAIGKVNVLTGGSVTVGTAGNSQPVSVMQPYLALNFVIAVSGLYPDRP
jgi:microcystin-dependent protein